MSEAQDKLLQGEMNMTLNMAMMTSARDAVGKDVYKRQAP